MLIAQQDLFRGGTLTTESASLPDGELLAQFGFSKPREREVEIIAPQQKMFADSGAGEIDLVTVTRNTDQREIAGAAANIADEDHLAIEEQTARACEVIR